MGAVVWVPVHTAHMLIGSKSSRAQGLRQFGATCGNEKGVPMAGEHPPGATRGVC
ncbi:hypothetical protein BD310DRAFT_812274 [Dichomitus squalens]|uniref:Uncharacterized protein n=1 Tax=Dichomitus squalens TaxID=114155 RepID=A0A4Q9Q4H2_9APHY|nr:hypothetical protein BD310DRAFT_812274 [Dichomitus squalens]